MADTHCQYCWTTGEHQEGCPAISNEPKAIEEWERGYAYGWDDNTIRWPHSRHYSETFLLGYRLGKYEIDILVDEAAQSWYA